MLTIVRPPVYRSLSSLSDDENLVGTLEKSQEAKVVDLPDEEWLHLATADELDAEAESEPERWYRFLIA